MNYHKVFLFLIVLISISVSKNRIIYTDPVPDAKFVSINNNVIIGFEHPVVLTDTEILNCIIVRGSKSEIHGGKISICSGNKIAVFKPDSPFVYGEKVDVTIDGRLIKSVDNKDAEFRFSFFTSKQKAKSIDTDNKGKEFTIIRNNLLDIPILNVSIDNNPSDGYIFTSPWGATSFLIISNSDGLPYWYTQLFFFSGDFKKQPNGHLTYYDGESFGHMEMDGNYNIVDSFKCGNGYYADIHELRVLNNRHALLMAYDTQVVDMSQIVPGGNPHANVIGLIIQELDENKDVIFQWRSWDHFLITDATHENLLDSVIDYVHGNAIEIDNDNNLLISSRHLDEITKINRTTGAIIWRLGGKNNQFTFVNDNIGFSHQHAIRRIPNGNITLYDNGNFHTPHFSRAVEYSLNEVSKTATLVWQYRNNPDIFGSWGGYVQRLSGGNTFIAWGGTSPTITEVGPDGTKVFEASYPQSVFTYRAYKMDWNGNPVSSNSGSGNLPAAYKLYQNYPNPFNPVTTIIFDLPKASQTELIVFDVTGREVKKFISAFLQAGSHKYEFDGSKLSSGLYFYRLSSGDFVSTQKMIMIK